MSDQTAQFVAYIIVLVVYGLFNKWYTDRRNNKTKAATQLAVENVEASTKADNATVGKLIDELERTVQRQSIEITELKQARERHRADLDLLSNEKGAVTSERDGLHRQLDAAMVQIKDLTKRVDDLEIEKRIWEAKDKMWTELLSRFTVVMPSAIVPPAEVQIAPPPIEPPSESSSAA
jgi:hypothetical protein